jgi:hypothetical protein
MQYTCPVCFYNQLDEPPADYNICDCCGTEFNVDDDLRTAAYLRAFWIARGAKWFFGQEPPMWNGWQQLADAGVELPYSITLTYDSTLPTKHNAYAQTFYFSKPGLTGGGVQIRPVGFPLIPKEPLFVSKPIFSPALEGEIVDSILGMAA